MLTEAERSWLHVTPLPPLLSSNRTADPHPTQSPVQFLLSLQRTRTKTMHSTVSLYIIYIGQFPEFLQNYDTLSGNALIMGDFSFHFETQTITTQKKRKKKKKRRIRTIHPQSVCC